MSSFPDLMGFLRLPGDGFMLDLWARYFAGSAVFGVHKKSDCKVIGDVRLIDYGQTQRKAPRTVRIEG